MQKIDTKEIIMIESIYISGYKSIREMDLQLKPINILIGANGSGKSNFISYFKLVDSIQEQRLHNYTMKNNAEDLVYFGTKHTQEIHSSIVCNDSQYSFCLQPRANGSMFIAEEKYSNGKEKGKMSFYTNLDESRILDSITPVSPQLKNHLKGFKTYHFHDTSETSTMRLKSQIDDNHGLSKDGGNLASILYLLKETNPLVFKRIEMVIRSVMPYFEKFILTPSPLDPTKIAMQWSDKNSPDKYFSAKDLSDGSIRFIALATLLMQPSLPELIIIDEPELGLHPHAISKLAGLIRSASQRNCQIIIASQSADLISNFEATEIITVDKKDGASIFSHLNEKELSKWLEDYSLGELWSKSIINGQPR